MKQYDINHDMRYLQLLAQSFPSIAEASTEIINLQAILNLPKGTGSRLKGCFCSFVIIVIF